MDVLDIFSFCRRNVCLVLSIFVFFLSADRRKKFPLRVILTLVIYFGVSILIYYLNTLIPEDISSASFLIFNTENTFYFLNHVLIILLPIFMFRCTACEMLTRTVADQTTCMLISILILVFKTPLTSLYELLDGNAGIAENIAQLIISLVIYAFIFIFFARKWHPGDRYMISNMAVTNVFYIVIVFILYWVNEISYSIMYSIMYSSGDSIICYSGFIVLFFLCVFVLVLLYSIQSTNSQKSKKQVLEQVIHDREQQYAMSKENVDIINKKCHDLKHQIQALKSISEDERDTYISGLEESIMIYGAVADTGNEVLDSVLSEKALRCEGKGIKFTTVVDSANLHVLQPIDLCTLFGNALDNAIEATEKIDDPDYRVISLNIYDKARMLCISLTNYSFIAPDFSGSGIKTTKQDKAFHGYGIGSIKDTAAHYNGNTQITYEDNTFTLFIAIPIPDDAAKI